MIIAIDYDNTLTADPEGWTQFIKMMQARGHEVVCVTGRSDIGEWGEEVRREIGGLVKIVFSGNQWKRAAAEKAGWKVNVWIDDMPEYIAKQYDLFTKHRTE